MISYTLIFLYGSFVYLKINLSNFPTSGFGFVLNFGLIGLIVANFWFLMKFWLSWTFIATVGNLFWLGNIFMIYLVLVTAFVANYALQHVKNHDQAISKLRDWLIYVYLNRPSDHIINSWLKIIKSIKDEKFNVSIMVTLIITCWTRVCWPMMIRSLLPIYPLRTMTQAMMMRKLVRFLYHILTLFHIF